MMISGTHIRLRPLREADWPLIEQWAAQREAFWGAYQRFQLDHLPRLHEALQRTALLQREAGLLLIEPLARSVPVGFVRYTLLPYPDGDLAHPEIGYGITDPAERGKGLAGEAVGLLVDYLMHGYPSERISAFTEIGNLPSQRLLARLGFQHEGTLRRVTFRDGYWRDLALYGLLRQEWAAQRNAALA